MKLELDLHGLREETSTHMERKDKESAMLQHRLQELQLQFTETQKLAILKEKVRPIYLGPSGAGVRPGFKSTHSAVSTHCNCFGSFSREKLRALGPRHGSSASLVFLMHIIKGHDHSGAIIETPTL